MVQVCGANQSCWADVVLKRHLLAKLYLCIYNYFSYLSPSFLFYCKDINRRHSLSESGVLMPSQSSFLIVGLLCILWHALAKPAEHNQLIQLQRLYSRFLLLWLLLWPIPASLCVQTPHAIRSFVGVPVLELVMSFGIAQVVNKLVTEMSTKPQKSTTPRCPKTSKIARMCIWRWMSMQHIIVITLSLMSVTWLIAGSVNYYSRYFTEFANESLKNFNAEASIQSFLDLKEARYYNKSRILVTQRVDNSFAYILYAECSKYSCLHANAAASLNEKLRVCGTPYELVLDDVASQYVLQDTDLLLLDVASLKRYTPADHERLQVVKHWFNYHGVVQLKTEKIDLDTVDDYDEF